MEGRDLGWMSCQRRTVIRTPCRYEIAKTESLTFIRVSCRSRCGSDSDRARATHSTSFDLYECLWEECRHKMSGLGHNDILVRLRERAFYSYVH